MSCVEAMVSKLVKLQMQALGDFFPKQGTIIYVEVLKVGMIILYVLYDINPIYMKNKRNK